MQYVVMQLSVVSSKSNANELEQRILLICIRIGTQKLAQKSRACTKVNLVISSIKLKNIIHNEKQKS